MMQNLIPQNDVRSEYISIHPYWFQKIGCQYSSIYVRIIQMDIVTNWLKAEVHKSIKLNHTPIVYE